MHPGFKSRPPARQSEAKGSQWQIARVWSLSLSTKETEICLHRLLYAGMTRSHFRLAGGPLSVMIYWFPSPVLQLDFSISHSLLLFYRHHRLERRWKDKQLQPAKLFKKQRRKMCGKRESHSWLAAESLMLHVWKGTVWKMVFQLCDTSVQPQRDSNKRFATCLQRVQTNIWLVDPNVPFFWTDKLLFPHFNST